MNVKKLEAWLNGIDSRHRAVLVVSKRAKQIQKGLRPYFDSKSSKVTTMALEEFIEGKMDWYELTPEEIEELQAAYERAKKMDDSSENPGVKPPVLPEVETAPVTKAFDEPDVDNENDVDTEEDLLEE